MNNAFEYNDYVKNGEKATPINKKYCEINDLSKTFQRASDFIIKPVGSNFEPAAPNISMHTLTIIYPSSLTMMYNEKKLLSNINGGSATSVINVPEEENGNPFFVNLEYTPKCRVYYNSKIYTEGILPIGIVSTNKNVTVEIRYKYIFSNPDKNATMVTLEDGTAVNADESKGDNSFSRSESSIIATIVVKSGYQISNFECDNCSVSATETENKYEITYGSLSITEANITIVTQEKQAEKTYYNVTVNGLGHSSVIYNNTTLSKNNGVSFIPNVESGTSISLTFSADDGYYLSSISYNGESLSYTNEPSTATISLLVNNNLTVTIVTKLQYFRVNFAGSPYINYVKLANQRTEGQDAYLIKYSISKMLNTPYELEFNYDTTQYNLTSVTCSNGATITKPTATNPNYLFTLTSDNTARIELNYTLVPIEKKSITFSGVRNVSLKKGSQTIDTSTDAYNETVDSGSSLVYTISPNEGYSLTDVSITPTSTKYSYSNGTLRISNTTDNVSIICTTTQKSELSLITVNLAVEGGTLGYLFLDGGTVLSEDTPLEITTGSKSKYYISPKALELGTIQSGKKISSVTCSAGGAITGNVTDGYYFQITDVYNYSMITITVVLTDETTAPTQKYSVNFHNSKNTIISYNNKIQIPSISEGDDLITAFSVEKGTNIIVKIEVTDTSKYEFAFIPTVSTKGYTSSWNIDEQTLTVQNIISEIDIYLNIRKKATVEPDGEKSALFYSEYSKRSSSLYWSLTENGYKYSQVLSGILSTTAWWICFEFKKNCNLVIETEYENIEVISIYRSANGVESSSLNRTNSNVINLSAEKYKVGNGYEIPASALGSDFEYNYIYFSFVRKISSNDTFIIKDVKYISTDIGTNSIFSSNGVYDSNIISDVHMIMECDNMATSLPYSTLSFKVYDEDNNYKLDSSEASLKLYSEYEVYTMSGDATNVDHIKNVKYYIAKIGRFRLKDIKHDNNYATFSFIGNIEYYNGIYLSSSEKRMSSFWNKINVKEYVKTLFGSDADVSGIPDYMMSLAPFTNESKAEILRTLCQFLNLYMYEGTDGKIHFCGDKSKNPTVYYEDQPFTIALDNSFNYPQIEQEYCKYDGVETEISTRYLESTKVLFENGVRFYAYLKTVDPGSNEDWTDDKDWVLFWESDNDSATYYDASRRSYVVAFDSNTKMNKTDEADFENIINSYGRIKYLRFRLDFGDAFTNVKYSAFNYFDTCPVNNYSFEQLYSYVYSKVIRGGGTGGYYTSFTHDERGMELYLTFPVLPSGSLAYLIDFSEVLSTEFPFPTGGTIDYPEIIIYIVLGVDFLIGKSTGQKIAIAKKQYKNFTNTYSDNILKIDNPLMASNCEAISCTHYALLKANSNNMKIVCTDWRGNGLVGLGDHVLVEHSTGRDSRRKYGAKYLGEVVKNEFIFNGALRMDTTIRLSADPYYFSPNSGEETMIFPSTVTKFNDGKINFIKKM